MYVRVFKLLWSMYINIFTPVAGQKCTEVKVYHFSERHSFKRSLQRTILTKLFSQNYPLVVVFQFFLRNYLIILSLIC